MGNLKGNKHFVLFREQFFVGLIVQSLFLLHFLVPSSPSFVSSSFNTQLEGESDTNSDEIPLFRDKRQSTGGAGGEPAGGDPAASGSGHGFTAVTLDNFLELAHGVKSTAIRITDDKTIEIDKFYYDGTGPAARFMVGNSSASDYTKTQVKLNGTIIQDENKSCGTLKKYDGKDIKLELPGNMTWSDVNYLSVYCLLFMVNFGSVSIPTMTRPTGAVKMNAPAAACIYDKSKNSATSVSVAARIGGDGLLRGLLKLFWH